MWKKGAVVIVKRGDEAMADAMASNFEQEEQEQTDIYSDDQKYDKAWKDLLSQAKSDAVDAMIAKARAEYGHIWTPPKWARRIMEGFAFIIYWICVFIDKYLIIRKEGER